tara:strand:+ start:228 stop:476 length:249 start_codon:yes stop_codon:yes gene_type:complete
MKEKIDNIFEAYEKDCISYSEMKEQLLNLHIVSFSLPNERQICKQARIIKKELTEDNQTFCEASYLMGACDVVRGDTFTNES